MTSATTPKSSTLPIDCKVYGNNGNENVLAHVSNTVTTVLDIGCGRGDNARHLKERGIIVDGITISEQELVQANSFLRNGVLCNVEEGLPEMIRNNKYDVIICSHVLEHLQYPGKLLNDIREVMTPHSIFIVALPNIMHYKSRWELVKGNFEYQQSGIWDNTHVKWYTFKSAINLLSASGFEIEKADVTGDIPLLSVFKWVLSSPMRKKIFLLLKKISKGFFGYELFYVCKIKPGI